MEAITAKTPWANQMDQIPMHLDYFEGSISTYTIIRTLTHNPAKSFKCFSFGNLNRIVLVIQ